MNCNNKIWVIGDASLDLVPDDQQHYLKCPGGASANVAVCVARLGGRCGFIGRLGQDLAGHFLAQTLQRESVDINNLHLDPILKTSVLIVSLKEDGERTFSYLVNPSADSFVCEQDLPIFTANEWFYFNSIGLVREPSRNACLVGARLMQHAGGSVLFDVNLREGMWDQPQNIRHQVSTAIALADICKISADELCHLSNQSDWYNARHYVNDLGCMTTIISLGAEGAYVIHQGKEQYYPTVPVIAIDTTGAGDAFVGGLLSRLAQQTDWRHQSLDDALFTANYCGAAVVTQKGAMAALPTAEQLATWYCKNTVENDAKDT